MKKKAIKIAAASAVAASAFVASAPLQSHAATNVVSVKDQAIVKMKVAYNTYSIATTNGNFADMGVLTQQYAAAKTAYASAKAVVTKSAGAQKDAYLAQLDANYSKFITKGVVTYIDAYNFGVKYLDSNKVALQKALDANNVTDIQKYYDQLNYQLTKRSQIIDRVLGQSTRDLLRSTYKTPALTTLNAAEAVLATPAVVSVSAINAKEVAITFNKAIKKDSVIETDGSLVNSIFTFSAVEGAVAVNGNTSTGSLSADGKTLTVTADTTFSGKYVVSVAKDLVQTTDGKYVGTYTSPVTTFSDSVRPALVGVSYPSNNVATLSFSEPLNVANAGAVESALTIKDANGAPVAATGLVTLSSDKKSFDLNIAGWATGKNYSVTLAGVTDFAGNLITPNPITTTVVNNVVDNVAPTVVSATAVKTGQLKVTLSEKVKSVSGVIGTYAIGVAAPVSIDLTPVTGNATLDASGTVVTLNVAGFTGLQTITLDGFKDLSNNPLAAAYSRVFQFTADTTAPSLISSEVKTISGSQYLVARYDEAVSADNTAGDVSGTYVDSNQVTHTVTITNNATNVSSYDYDGDGVNDSVKVLLTGQVQGNYSLTLPTGVAKDTATPANSSVTKSVSFNLGSAVDTGKPTILDADNNAANGYSGIVAQASEDTVTITFAEDVTAATALNTSNYLVEGQPVFSKAIFNGNQHTVKLTLNPNAINVSGTRYLQVKNVADIAGNVMDSVTTQVPFVENVKPTISSVKLTATNKITVTFSEAMLAANLIDNGDFAIKVNGVSDTVTGVVAGAGNSFVLTLTDAVTDLTKPITLTVLDTNNVIDSATPGNSLATTGTLTVTQ